MIEDMTVRNLSRSMHIYAVAKFSRHLSQAPDQLGMEDVRIRSIS